MTGNRGLCWVPCTTLSSMLYFILFFGQKPECLAKIKVTVSPVTADFLPDNYWVESLSILSKVFEMLIKVHRIPNFKNFLGDMTWRSSGKESALPCREGGLSPWLGTQDPVMRRNCRSPWAATRVHVPQRKIPHDARKTLCHNEDLRQPNSKRKKNFLECRHDFSSPE